MRRSGVAQVVLAVLAGALVLANVLTVFVLTRPPEVIGVDGPLKAELVTISAWVAKLRGLDFTEDIVVEVLAQDAFAAKLRSAGAGRSTTEDEAKESAARAQAVADSLFALGVVERRYAPEDAATTYRAAVTGAYDNRKDRLYLPDVPLTPFRRQVIAHELVHALDDQHFDLGRDFGLVNEAALAFQALVEGNARDVENRYAAAMSSADRASAEAEQAGIGPSAEVVAKVPQSLLALFSFPYSTGSQFVSWLRSARGEAGVDDALRNPPISTEAILRPDRWIAGDLPRNTTHPKPNGKVVSRDVLGELGLRLMLVNHGGAEAVKASEGWGGDRTVTWLEEGRTCVAAAIRMDTTQDMDELVDAFATWRSAHPDAVVVRSGDGTPKDELAITHCIAR